MSAPTILFYFPVSTLMDKVKMHSAMVARMLPDGFEKYAFSSDETVFFHSEMDKNIKQVYNLFQKLSVGITSALVLNGPSTPGGTDFGYGFYINGNDAIAQNSIDVITGNIQNLLVNMLLQEWWLKCGLADQYKISIADVQKAWSGLNNSMYPLFKSVIVASPSYANATVDVDRETGIETVTP